MSEPNRARKPSSSGSVDLAYPTAPGFDAGVQEDHQEGRHDQRQDAGDDALRHVTLRIVRFLRRQRQLLDGEEEPHGERQGREDARNAEGQERPAAIGQFDAARTHVERPAREVELAGEDHRQIEDRQARECEQRDRHRDLERQFDADDVEPDEQRVADDPVDRLEARIGAEDAGQIRADEEHDHGRREHELDILGDAGDVARPRAHRRACERIGAARMRQRRRHFGEREGQPEIHDRNDDRREEHRAEALRQSEIPTGIMAGDDRADAERPERPDARITLQPPRLEIGVVYRCVGDARCALRRGGRGMNPRTSLSDRHETSSKKSLTKSHGAPCAMVVVRASATRPSTGVQDDSPTTPVHFPCGSGRCGFRSSEARDRAPLRGDQGCETPDRPVNRVRSCRH